ncbi:hypothetical protein [Nonomuraea salmonea]|uniref:hypothetical protein n=1 Tax=Nonomuraea salmonea TaxID=46181 RepID=UPI002FE6FCA9
MLGTAETEEVERDVPGVTLQDEAKARKAEKIVALCFTITFLAAIAFIISYVVFQVGSPEATGTSTFALGTSLTVAILGLAVGIVIWVRQIMPKYSLVQERHTMASEEDDREVVSDTFVQGANESGFVKRKLLRRTLLLAAAPLGLVPPWSCCATSTTARCRAPSSTRRCGTRSGAGPPRRASRSGSSSRAPASPSGRPTSTRPAASCRSCPRVTSTTSTPWPRPR